MSLHELQQATAYVSFVTVVVEQTCVLQKIMQYCFKAKRVKTAGLLEFIEDGIMELQRIKYFRIVSHSQVHTAYNCRFIRSIKVVLRFYMAKGFRVIQNIKLKVDIMI